MNPLTRKRNGPVPNEKRNASASSTIMKAARFKARTAIQKYDFFTPPDQDDIAGELNLAAWRSISHFNASRGSFQTFVSRVMDNQLRTILRYHLAFRRRRMDVPFPGGLDGEVERLLTGMAVLHFDNLRDLEFWLDVKRALESFPPTLLAVALALSRKSPTELSRTQNMSRSTIYTHICRLRAALEAAGIEPTYFDVRKRCAF